MTTHDINQQVCDFHELLMDYQDIEETAHSEQKKILKNKLVVAAENLVNEVRKLGL